MLHHRQRGLFDGHPNRWSDHRGCWWELLGIDPLDRNVLCGCSDSPPDRKSFKRRVQVVHKILTTRVLPSCIYCTDIRENMALFIGNMIWIYKEIYDKRVMDRKELIISAMSK